MENAIAIAAVAGPVYIIIGLSVLLYAPVWQKIVADWRKDHLSLLTMMMMHLVIGLIVIGMYNIWEWNVWLIVTLTGWGMLLKGVFYFLLPGSWLKNWLKMVDCRMCMYCAGFFATLVGAVLCYYVYYV